MSTKTVATKKHNWRDDPAGPKQVEWINRNLAERKVGISLRDQAAAALANAELTKGEASDLLDELFKCLKKADAEGVGQGVYRQGDNVFLVRPNKKYEENPKQQGAGHYSMALVPAPHAATVRYELVFDPEARLSLATGDRVGLDGIVDIFPKCSTKAKKALETYV